VGQVARTFGIAGILSLAASGALSDSGRFQLLWQFGAAGHGTEPSALLADTNGNLYGTTFFGGQGSCFSGKPCGVVFSLSQAGGVWSETVLYRFLAQLSQLGL
jgi:hypothetical protein